MNLLLAINGHIYEVSQFVSSHPGEGIANVYLLEHNRHDVSEYFLKYHQTNDSEQELIDARNNNNDKIKYIAPYYFQNRIPKYYYYVPDITKIDMSLFPNKSYFIFQSDEESNQDTINLMVKDAMGMSTVHHLKLMFNDNKLSECYVELCSYIDNMEHSNENLDNAKIITTKLEDTTREGFIDKYFTNQGYQPILKIA